MRAFKFNARRFRLLLAATLCTAVIPFCSLADDKETSNPPTKSVPANPDSPAPLTGRERWMLDRMERLEKRVAELESKSNTPVAFATEVSPLQPASSNPSMSSLLSGATSAAPAAVAITNVIPAEKIVELRTAQATEAGKSGAAKPAAAEPFAFADFTWLNGNARTKQLAMDTKFFTPEIRADVDYIYDFNHPKDNTISGSSEVFRANEVQATQLGVGGDFHYDNVRVRLLTQFGCIRRRRRAMTPALRAANGILIMLTGISRKPTAVTTSMRYMESTSTPESLCPISVSSATTNSTIGRISRRMFHRTRPGFSTAFASRFFRRST